MKNWHVSAIRKCKRTLSKKIVGTLLLTILASITSASAAPLKAPCEVSLAQNRFVLLADLTWKFSTQNIEPVRKAYKFFCRKSGNENFSCSGVALNLDGIIREGKLGAFDIDLITDATARIEGANHNTYRVNWGDYSFSFDVGGILIDASVRHTEEGALYSKCSAPKIILVP